MILYDPSPALNHAAEGNAANKLVCRFSQYVHQPMSDDAYAYSPIRAGLYPYRGLLNLVAPAKGPVDWFSTLRIF